MDQTAQIEHQLDIAESQLEGALDELKRTGDIQVVRDLIQNADHALADAGRIERGF